MDNPIPQFHQWLYSPLAAIGAALLLAQCSGLLLARYGLPRLYGAVLAGLLLGVSGAKLLDAALIAQFHELFNAAVALVLFEAGRKMDLAWLWQNWREGISLLLSCLLCGVAAFFCLHMFGLQNAEAALLAATLTAASPVIFASSVTDANATGSATFAASNQVALGNVLALVLLVPGIAWFKHHEGFSDINFVLELWHQIAKLGMGCAIALFCYGLYVLATRLSAAKANKRPGMLLASLLMDLGMCSISGASALLSLLLMGLLLRNAKKRDNVFQAQLKTFQEIGYALLFMLSASLVQMQQLLQMQALSAALLIFILRIVLIRCALIPGQAWNRRKKHALALSLCSLASFGSLMVDNAISGFPGMSDFARQIMYALLGLNLLLAPGLTWYGLHLAGESAEENTND